MIPPDARVTVQRIGLHRILLCEFQVRYPERLGHYIDLLRAHPGEYAGCLSVAPSHEYKGLYDLLDGHHRLCAYILLGRTDALCLVIEEERKHHDLGEIHSDPPAGEEARQATGEASHADSFYYQERPINASKTP